MDDLVKHLRGGLVMQSVGLRAADRIEELETALAAVGNASAHRITDLEAALTRANAATAAAYEMAADACADYPRTAPDEFEWTRYDEQIEHSQRCIRALATPDQTAALDRLIAEAAKPYAEALAWYGEQARLARLIHSEGDAGRNALQADGGKRANAILAASKKGGQ